MANFFPATGNTLDRNSHEALYLQLANTLARQVAAAAYAPGDRLPTEEELIHRYHVSRVTVRQAMRLLRERGLIVRRPAKGTFIAGPLVKQDLAVLGGFYDALVAQGFQPTMRLLDYRLVRCPPGVRAKLHHEKAMWLLRQHWVGATQLAVACTHLHPSAQCVSRAQVEANPSYRILEDLLGFTIARADLAIRADRAEREPARLLGVGPATPVLILERITYAPSGEPLEYTVFYLRPDAYEFALTIRGPMPIASSIRAAARPAQSLEGTP